MLKKILLVVVVLIVIFVLVGFLLPTDYSASRSVVIAADKARIHEFVGELKRWDDWAPWKESDPTLVTTLGDKTTGVGAHQSWTGEDGAGELTLTKCSVEEGIAYDMNFIMGEEKVPAQSWMSYAPASGGVEVTWGMKGKMDMPVVGGWLVLMMGSSIDDMFEKGLQRLKTAAEARR